MNPYVVVSVKKGETMNGLASALFLGNEGNWDGNMLIFLEYTPLI